MQNLGSLFSKNVLKFGFGIMKITLEKVRFSLAL